MKPGDRVMLFTSSGTFRGHRGWVTEATTSGAYVRVEGESVPLHFATGEIVRERQSHHGGAE